MLNNNGNAEGLFSGAWMQSGFPLPLNNYSELQGTYDALVDQTTCAGSSSSESLDCLKQLSFDELYLAILTVPPDERFGVRRHGLLPEVSSVLTVLQRWQVLLDEDFIAEQPETQLTDGRIALVPFVVGVSSMIHLIPG